MLHELSSLHLEGNTGSVEELFLIDMVYRELCRILNTVVLTIFCLVEHFKYFMVF